MGVVSAAHLGEERAEAGCLLLLVLVLTSTSTSTSTTTSRLPRRRARRGRLHSTCYLLLLLLLVTYYYYYLGEERAEAGYILRSGAGGEHQRGVRLRRVEVKWG